MYLHKFHSLLYTEDKTKLRSKRWHLQLSLLP